MALLVVGLPAFGVLFVPASAMISDGADRRHLHQGLAFGLANLAWAAGQGVAAASSGALAQATVDAFPFVLLAAVFGLTALALRPSGRRLLARLGVSGTAPSVTVPGTRRGRWAPAGVGRCRGRGRGGPQPHHAASAAYQVWSPFVLVAGPPSGRPRGRARRALPGGGLPIARLAPNGFALFAGASVLVALVTAVLNLDTSVVFLTPVLVHAARSRGHDEGPLLYGCLLLSNAGSLLLPGSNLTNLIVAGHLHVSGAAFFDRMAPAWVVGRRGHGRRGGRRRASIAASGDR